MSDRDVERRSRARRGLAVYFAVLVPLTALVQGAIFWTGDPIESHVGLVFALMWSPALASLVARLVVREGPEDVSFRLGKRRAGRHPLLARSFLVAWISPLFVGLVAYGAAWLTGLETFAPRSLEALGLAHTPGLVRLAVSIGVMLTLGTVMSAATALGEELGWRGYMLTRLVDAGVPRPVLVSAAIWGAWHLPLIVSGQYAAGPRPLLSAACFFVGILGGGLVAGYVRLASGSVWPAVVFHAAWNSLIQGTFDGFTKGGNASHTNTTFTGESGIFVGLVSLGFAVWLARKPLVAYRSPSEADAIGEMRLL
jgi:uncharacterized protein